jgi:alkylated DNA repair dioxygenase AlkB
MASDSVRTWLDPTSWVDVHRGWVAPDLAADLYDALTERLPWRSSNLFRYDHWVEENRLGASWRPGTPSPHPALVDVHREVRHLVGKPLMGPAFNWYRDAGDGQAFHRDRDLRWCEDTVIAILTLGATRPWLLRPRANRYDHDEARFKGTTHDLAPAAGDLLVMGGRCQADWEHSVPVLRRPVGGRISVQWRWTARTGRPELGGSYRSPRFYSRR